MELLGSTIVTMNKDYVYCKVEDEMVLLGMEDGIYYGLNPVGAFIWEQIKDPKTIDEVRDAILVEYNVGKVECEQDLYELLQELVEKGLVEVKK
ncbi:PqqD family protein [Methanobacterium ferruginis]|uniref:PqqD family protein n=1 Tax=Methanobacterium ferruginis TaxID=710191 RepID=UPI00257449C5|nr:PqqD family protein [Methanobacterium ferruginis]BDZ69016.1 hydrogenase expression protein HypA [Methanobacterium ferruginis]